MPGEPGNRGRLWERYGPALLEIGPRSVFEEEDGTPRRDWLRRGLLAVVMALRGGGSGADRLFRDLVWEIDPGTLPGLEAECRRHALGSYAWYGFRASRVAGWASRPLARGALTWHPDGWVREAALQELAADAYEVPFVLLRLNDWVPEIRALASTRLEALLDPDRAADLVRWLPLVQWLGLCGRADHQSTVRRVQVLLRRPEVREALEGALDLPWRRNLYPLALQAADDPDRILDRALADRSPAVASWAARRVRHRPPNPERSRRMRVSLMAPVREEGVKELAREGDPVAAEGFLLDPHPAVRAMARWVLGGRDHAERYRQVLEERPASVRLLKAALAGLGETGEPAHAILVQGWLGHGHPGVRRSAVRALGALEGNLTLLLPLLGDPYPAVAREAAAQMLRRPPPLRPETVYRALGEPSPAHALPLRMAVLRRTGKWTALPWLLEAAAVPEWKEAARTQVDSWLAQYNWSAFPPSRADLDRLERTLDAHPRALSAPTEAVLRQILGSWRRQPGG